MALHPAEALTLITSTIVLDIDVNLATLPMKKQSRARGREGTGVAIVAHLSLLRSLAAAAGAILVAGFTTPASAARPIDCPLRDQAYSLDSPVIDILIKPEAKAVFDRNAPPALKSLPAWLQGTTPP